MGRKKKSVLNQIVGEPKIKKEEVVIEPEVKPEEFAKLFAPDIEPLIPTEIEEISLKASGEPKEQEEISLKISGEKITEVLEKNENPVYKDDDEEDGETEEPVVEGITIIKPSKEQLSRLSKSGLRWYQRTGMLPK